MTSLGPTTYVALTPDEAKRLAAEMRGLAWLRPLPPTNPYEALRCEAEGARFTLWTSGKLAYQGPRARELLEELARATGLADGAGMEAGSDEAGKGEWLGPMCVAAVALGPEARVALRFDGVRDSKALSAQARTALATRIRARAAACEVVTIGPARFNELWTEMHARGETLNDLLWWAHRKALEPVLARVRGEAGLRVVLDEFDKTRRAERMFAAILPAGAQVEQRPRGEERAAVAAASVLARAERDRQVALLRERFGLPEDLTPQQAREHPQATQFAKVAYVETWDRPR